MGHLEKEFAALNREIQKEGYRIIDRPYDKDEIEVEGQIISLPFSNMSGIKVLLKNVDGKWEFIKQGQNDTLAADVESLVNPRKKEE